jgi:DNA-binding transcriptional MerR regulator/methylmalonyl-CoA mutase cobalamin-binding subunit
MTTPSPDEYDAAGGYPIGMAATLTGLPVDVIRVWERRYGLPRPARSAGGHRLYRPRDVALLRRASALRAQGLTAASACAQALAEAAPSTVAGDEEPADPGAPAPPGMARLSARLYDAAVALDAATARSVLTETGALLAVETLWSAVLAPALDRLGTDWARGVITPAPEHLLSNVIRGRLSALLEALPRRPDAPSAVVGGAPGERHELAGLMLALLLGRAGWAVTYLGADTPPEAWEEAVSLVRPRVVVVSATLPEHAASALTMMRWIVDRLGRQAPLFAYGGPGFARTPTPGEDTSPFIALGNDLDGAIQRLLAVA